MLSSINWIRQLIARDQAKLPQLKNQLTKSNESSQPTIVRDKEGQNVYEKVKHRKESRKKSLRTLCAHVKRTRLRKTGLGKSKGNGPI
jgi:N-acetylglutamate synthase/N-acetylornithine aminotransferase